MNAVTYLYERFDLTPVSETDLQVAMNELIKRDRQKMIRWGAWLWAILAIASLVIFFLVPAMMIFTVIAGLALIYSQYRYMIDIKHNASSATASLMADALPPFVLGLMREDEDAKTKVIELMRQQGGSLFAYQAYAFDYEKTQRQRNALKQAVDGVAE